MSTPGAPGGAALYLRQSKGSERSISEQKTGCRGACQENNWHITEVYTDTVSASKYARRGRPGWTRLLEDLDAGRFAILVMWESSRGDRKLSSWALLLDKCEERGVRIHVVAHERTYDPARSRDWETLADEGVRSASESNKTRDRVRRTVQAGIIAGDAHGPAPYGYERVYDPKTRALLEQRPHPREAAIVAEIVSRVALGDPISAIRDDLQTRGIKAPKGGEWGRTTIRSIASNATYLGKRRSGVRVKRDPDLTSAAWAPIITEADYYAARRRLTDPARKTTRPGRVRWLLSYIARCDHCGGFLVTAKRGAVYRCAGNLCTSVRREWLDEYASELVIAWVQREGVLSHLMRSSDEIAVQARAEATRLREQLDEQARMAGRGELSLRSLAIAEQELLPLLDAAEKRAMAAGLPPSLRSLATERDLVPERWAALPVAVKRESVAALMSLRLRRAEYRGPGRRQDISRRVVVEWEGKDPGSSPRHAV